MMDSWKCVKSEVHRGPKRSTEVQRGPKRSTWVHRGPQSSKEVHSGPQGSTAVHRGPKRSSEVQRGPQGSKEVLGSPKRSTELQTRPQGSQRSTEVKFFISLFIILNLISSICDLLFVSKVNCFLHGVSVSDYFLFVEALFEQSYYSIIMSCIEL